MNKIPKQEISQREKGVFHRLINDQGECTVWAGYTQFTYLDGYVGYTAYYIDTGGVKTAADFCATVGAR